MTVQLSGLEIIAQVIRENYDLGDVATPTQLPAAHQRRHRKMVVETSTGKFLVKTYKRDLRELDALRFQHRLSDHLLANGLPVARIQRTKTGDSLVEKDNWAMELQVFVDAHGMHLNRDTLRASAEALGKFHEVCRDFPVPPRDAVKWRFSEVPRGLFAKLYERAARESNNHPQVIEACNQIGLFLTDAAKELSEDKRNEFETGLIHGDWHGGNLMYRGNELAAIVDLEFSGDGCYLEDIAYGISNLCVRTSMEPDQLEMRTNLLLDHYQIHRSLSYAEMVALYYAVGVKHIATVSYQVEQHGGLIAGYNTVQWIERLSVQSRWLAEQSRKARWGE